MLSYVAIGLLLFASISLAVPTSAERANHPNVEINRNGKRKSVLIIGGGINGASAAYFINTLAKGGKLPAEAFGNSDIGLAEEEAADVRITIAEASNRLGGRVASKKLSTGHFVELGASVYHQVNRYLSAFHKQANLTTTHPYSSSKVGLFSNTKREFTFAESPHSNSLMGKAITMGKAIWRYGIQPMKAKHLVDEAVSKLDRVYNLQLNQGKTFSTAEELLEELGLLEATRTSVESLLKEKGGGLEGAFLDEFVYAFTRINYGQGLEIGGLAGLVAMKGGGDEVFSAAEGNDAAIQFLAESAEAEVMLNERFAVHDDEGADCLTIQPTEKSQGYDVVVLAFPQPHRSRYEMKVTHATWVQGTLNASHFGYGLDEVLPTVIIPIRENDDALGTATTPPYRHLGRVKGSTDVYKIFSDRELSVTADLETDGRPGRSGSGGPFIPGSTKILHHEKWEAYPVLAPRSETEPAHPFKLNRKLCGGGGGGGPVIIDANALEFAVSTMETQAIASMNAALLALESIGISVGPESQKRSGSGSQRGREDL